MSASTSGTLEPVERRSTTELAAEAIRANITDGSFPPGAQLTEATLARELGVSRGPVREALQRLIQEGLLVSVPHRGVFVTTLDAAAVEDLYRARAAIEQAAARVLIARPNRDLIRPLAGLVDEMAAAALAGDPAGVADVDLRFHEALVEAANSPRLSRMYATLLVETRLCLNTLAAGTADRDSVVREHRDLVRALRARNADRVRDCIDEHLGRVSIELATRSS